MTAPVPLYFGPAQAAAALQALHADAGAVAFGIATPHTENRTAARAAMRAALQDLVGQWWQCTPQHIEWHCKLGQRLAVRCGSHTMHLSLSHAPGLSVAVLHRHYPIGVDILRTDSVQEGGDLLSDWELLAHDYLGPAAYFALKNTPDPQRTGHLASQWSALEATLKCLGLGLTEWSAQLQLDMDRCQLQPLHFPTVLAPDYCGAIAVLPNIAAA